MVFKVNNNGWAILKDLPTGELFKRKEDSKKVYVRGHYNKSDRAYSCTGWDDTNNEIFLKSNTKVFVDFNF